MATLHYQSARGVYFDIQYSHFRSTVGDFEFYFTSEFNMNKFNSLVDKEIEEFNRRVNSMYRNNHNLDFQELGLIRLYKRIEKRGFLLFYKGNKVDCPENIVFKTELVVE